MSIKKIFSLAILFILYFTTNLFAATLAPKDLQKDLKSKMMVIVYAGKFIDAGEFEKSNQLLKAAIKKFPKNDMIAALYGKSLYESGDQKNSETYFMKALKGNPDNIMAQQYIEQIRAVRILSSSQESQVWSSIVRDKVADLIVFVLSIWIGTSINSVWIWGVKRHQWRKAKRHYINNDYHHFLSILESYVAKEDQEGINNGLKFMLENERDIKKIQGILTDYVIRSENLNVLMRSFQFIESRMS